MDGTKPVTHIVRADDREIFQDLTTECVKHGSVRRVGAAAMDMREMKLGVKRQCLAVTLTSFDLPDRARLTVLASSHNHVFRVDCSRGRFVLRLQSPTKLSDRAAQLQLHWLRSLSHLRSLSVPAPLLTRHNQPWAKVHIDSEPAPRRAILLRWVPGQPLRCPQRFVEPHSLRAIGRVVAKMHLHAERFTTPKGLTCRRIDASTLLDNPIAPRLIDRKSYRLFQRAAKQIRAAMDAVGTSKKEFGLIHADLGPANWIFHKGKPSPIDFDEFGRGFYVFDLLTVLWSHAGWDDYASYRADLLHGYQEIRPLSDRAKAHLDTFQAATYFEWLNHGCRLSDSQAQAEFLHWVPWTAQRVASLCALS